MPNHMTVLAALLVLALGSPAAAQDNPTTALEDIVVVARRSGAPVWRVHDGDSTVLLVGSIRSIPRDIAWRPEALEAAVLQADSIVMSQSATMSLGDFMRLRRAKARLPEGRTVADYLDAEQQDRLRQLGASYRQDYSKRGLVAIAQDLLDRRLAYRRGSGRSAEEVIRSAARKADKSSVLVGDLDARHIDEAAAVPDQGQTACLVAAITATEAGQDGVDLRASSWARQDIPTLMATPMEQAVDRCTWFADSGLRSQGRAQWRQAFSDALGSPKTTMMVMSVSIAAEAGGLLDQAEAKGLEISGPDWKPD